MTKLAPWALLALLPIAACNSNPTNPFGATVPQPTPNLVVASAQDGAFAMQAAMSDMFEIQSAQLALQTARRPAIRAFAQRMINEHTATTQQLTAMAPALGITMPTALDPAQEQKMGVLRAAGRTFDREYLSAQISAHQDAVTVFQTEANGGRNPNLVAFAQQTLPHVQEHLATAQRLRGN